MQTALMHVPKLASSYWLPELHIFELPYSDKFSPGVNFRQFHHASQVAKI